MKKLELLEGEMICPKCNGTGVYYNKYDISSFTCSKCNGDGKLDWIENIVGKQNKYSWWGANYSTIKNYKRNRFK